jgi:hypothetical protein
MPELAALTGYARYTLQLRWPAVLVLVGVLVSLPLLWPLTMPDLHRDLGVPPHRFVVVVSAALASLVVMILLPLEPVAERLAARNMVVARLALAVTVVLLVVAVIQLLLPVPSGTFLNPVARNAAGLTGIGLALTALNVPVGLVGPWLLVLLGALFGYDTHPGAAASLRPWAWVLAEDGSGFAPAVLLLALGVGVHAASRPRAERGL